MMFDGPDVVAYGFPLINCAPSLASSMEENYFALETLFNMLCHITFWLLIGFGIDRKITRITISNHVISFFGGMFLFYMACFIYFFIEFNHSIKPMRNFKTTEVMDTGFKWMWENPPQPDYYKYHPEKRKAH